MKNKLETSEGTRRKFINEGLFSGLGWALGLKNELNEGGDKVKMLTPDGKVVEVPSSMVKPKSSKTKNQDILEWRKTDKK